MKDNFESIKQFVVPAKRGETKPGFFQLYMDPAQWKVYHATRLLSKKMEAALKPHSVKGLKYRGTIIINDFEVVKIKADDAKDMTYHALKRNIEDTDIVGLGGKIQSIIDEFKPSFE